MQSQLWITTNLACRILHKPFHSIACSSPRFYKGCKCQHTSRRSEKWQGRERWSENDPSVANGSKTKKGSVHQSASWYQVYICKGPLWHASLGKSTYSPLHKTFIQSSCHRALRRWEEPLAQSKELPGGGLGHSGQGKLWLLLVVPPRQGGCRIPRQALVRLPGFHSQSPHGPVHTSLKWHVLALLCLYSMCKSTQIDDPGTKS